MDSGSTVQAILASSAIPGFFPPHFSRGKALVTGSLTGGSGVQAAKEKGADIIIALKISENFSNNPLTDQKDIIMRAHLISRKIQVLEDLEKADVLIEPDLTRIKFDDFSQKRKAIFKGQEATLETIESIKKLIEHHK